MKKNLLSVVVSVYNGEDVLEDCLKSVAFADEVIVVDNSSLDKTVEIAYKYTKNIYKQKNDPLAIDLQKNFGFSKATGEWILSLDADERVTPELKAEIESRIKNQESGISGYWIPRKNIIFGKWIEHTGWYPDHQMRLFRNGKGKFEEKHVHEMIKIIGPTGYLKGDLLHYNYSTIAQFINKLNIYVINEAEQLIKNGYKFKWQDAIRFPVKEFLSRFFAREGYKDGLHGLILSLLMAFYHFVIFSHIWEKHKFKQINDATLLEDTEKEIVGASKELFFWFSKEKIKLIKNPLKQIFHRVLRKVKP